MGKRKVTTSISFVPSGNDQTANIIRIGVTEELGSENQFLNGNIDICSNGDILVHDFTMDIYDVKLDQNSRLGWAVDENNNILYEKETIPSSLDNSAIHQDALRSIQNYIMRVFELADLKHDSCFKR